ncbi:h-caldesmon, partial [Fusarium agapanthi]
MPSDLETLLDMGFDKERAEIAVKKTGGLQGALQWLEDNQDKPIDEIKAAAAAKEEDDDDEDTEAKIAELETGTAKSLICNDCGKRFKNHDLATYHATKTEHTDFSESTEEIAPLTEDEKKAKLEQLRERLAAKRALQSVKDKEDHKRNEQIRAKATKESQEAKEELARKQAVKEAAQKRQEKLEDQEAKRRIKAKIEADKAERRRKAEEAKAAREGRAPQVEAAIPGGAAAVAAASKPKSNNNEARLRLQTDGGNNTKTLPAE